MFLKASLNTIIPGILNLFYKHLYSQTQIDHKAHHPQIFYN